MTCTYSLDSPRPSAEDGESFNADMFTKNEKDLNNLMTELNGLIGKVLDVVLKARNRDYENVYLLELFYFLS